MSKSTGNAAPLCLVLGLWLGGSLFLFGVAIYNFDGIEHSFQRNPKLAAQAGFDPTDEEALKTSLIWVHSSELNRVFFETWGWVQLGIGAAALILALVFRQGLVVSLLVVAALLLAVYSSWQLVPEIVSLGRSLDFVPRTPQPAQLEAFGKSHGIALVVDFVRTGLVLVAGLVAAVRSGKTG